MFVDAAPYVHVYSLKEWLAGGEEMTTQEYRRPKTIGISISDSPDMKMLGLGNGHLRDAMTEVATYLMSSGEDLAYGGDLRENGFTWTLFELASRYTKQASAFTSPSREDRGLIDDSRRDRDKRYLHLP